MDFGGVFYVLEGAHTMLNNSKQPAPEPIAYSVPHTAARVGISRAGLWALIRAGKGPRVTTIGRRSVILVSDCNTWLAANQAA